MRIWTDRVAIAALGVCLTTALGASCGSAPVVQDDVDGDGFVASIDNCTTRANPDQRDSDRDGAGDACDADYDQNGRVGVSDFSRFRSAFGLAKGTKGFDPRYDHNGDGRIGLPDFNVLRASYGRAPGPFADDDGDGVPVAMDLCPGGLSGETAIGHGCSVFDVAARPHSVLTPLIEGLTELESEIGSAPGLRTYGVAGYLGNAIGVLDSALAIAARADPCGGHARAAGGPATAGGADASLAGAIAMIDTAQQDLIDAGPPGRGPVYGDTTEWDDEVSGFDYWRSRVEQKRASLGDALDLLDTACQQTTSFTSYRGVVRRFDAAERRIELENGRVFAMADGFQLVAASPIGGYNDLSEGDEARFSGIYAGDGGVAVTAGPLRVPEAQPDVPDTFACLRTRFAPFQRFDVLPTEIELHEPIAYFADARYRLEKGMRVGAESFCTIRVGQQQWLRFSMEVRFTPSGGQQQVLATDYFPTQMPIPLPEVHLGTITVLIHTQDCNGNYGFPNSYNCGPKEEKSSTDYPFVQRPHWNNCYARYGRSDRTYTVDDRQGTVFDPEQLVSLHLSGDMYYDGGTVPEFEAEGFATTANSPSSFPATEIRRIGDWFAIHNSDFYPVYGPTTDAEALELIKSQGVQYAGGLRWPRIRGTLNGRTFAYSCHVPPVVRDAVDLCPNSDDHAFYRLPFPAGDTSWAQGQGNDGSFTHSGGFAYDMIAPLGETILVARSGRVVGVQESEYRQCCDGCDVEASDDNPCPRGNYLWVEHQDGTIGQYVHMPQNGVDPEVGDLVRRGDRVGEVGVTGNTTGPHLHFAARYGIPGSGLPTRLALFEALDPDDLSEVLTCYEPPNIESGPREPLRSTNVER